MERKTKGNYTIINVSLKNIDNSLLVPIVKIRFGQRAFAVRGAKIRNEFSQEAKQAPF